MFRRHGTQAVFRAWKRSLLFCCLLGLIMLILCISLSLTTAIHRFFITAKDTYTTIGVLEYMGAEYPNEAVYDSGLGAFERGFQSSVLENAPGVLQWDPAVTALGSISGADYSNPLSPCQNNAVLVVKIRNVNPLEAVYGATVMEELYAHTSRLGGSIYFKSDIPLQQGHCYLIHGQYYQGKSSYTYFTPAAYTNAAALASGVDGDISQMLLDVTAPNGGYRLPDDSIFYKIAETYRVLDSSVTVYASRDVSALLPFHQGTLRIESGRPISPEEQAAGAHVCLISAALAGRTGYGVNDTIRLSLSYPEACSRSDSYWVDTGFDASLDFTIVGLTTSVAGMENNIYVPNSPDLAQTGTLSTYTVGQVTLENDQAEVFLNQVQPQLPERARLRIYDQGYAAAAKPLQDVSRVAVLIAAASVLAGAAVIGLYGYLAVYRQKDTAQTMLRLGVENRSIYAYYLWGGSIIALIAVLLGGLCSVALSGRFFSAVNEIAARYAAGDLRYSSSYLSVQKPLALSEGSAGLFVVIGLCVFALSLLSCVLFTYFSVRQRKHKRRWRAAHSGGKSRSMHGGSLKYAALSIGRGGLRGMIPLMISFFAALLLLQLSGTANRCGNNLRQLEEAASIQCWFTGIDGTQLGSLRIEGWDINELFRSDCFSSVSATKTFGCAYQGRTAIQGVTQTLSPSDFSTSFGWETMKNRMESGLRLTCTDDLSKTPEFFYASSISTTFLDGYDASILTQKVGDLPCCLVSTDLMKENQIQLGDTIRLLVLMDDYAIDVDFYVVGSYGKQARRDTVYCQLSAFCDPALLTNTQGEPDTKLQQYAFSSAVFQLKSGAALSPLKQYLFEHGYSEVNRAREKRSFVLIEDRSFLSTQRSLSQRLWYMERIFPALYVLLGVLALLISYILIQNRKRELAVMQSLGAPTNTATASLLLEQLLLCLTGVAVGSGVWLAATGSGNTLGLLLAGTFFLCWMLGSVLSLRRAIHFSVMRLLHDED